MTWQLFSPDLPFLNQITVVQEKHGFWECFLPYAPLVTAVISAVISIIAICVTYYVARKAREITTEQKAIAAQAKQIAQDKFDLDLFDKRYSVIAAYNCLFQEIGKPLLEKDSIRQSLVDFQSKYIYFPAMFNEEDENLLNSAMGSMMVCVNFRIKNLDKSKFSQQLRDEFDILYEKSSDLIDEVRELLVKYSSPAMKRIPAVTSSTTRPASPDTPPPTAPTADQ